MPSHREQADNNGNNADTTDAPVIIVGAGPVGLSLALGLARLGVRSILVERKSSTSVRSKAPAIHIRTREIFRQWGIESRILEAGVLLEELIMHNTLAPNRPIIDVDFEILADEANRPGIIFLEQGKTERLLLEAVRETGLCDVRFDTEVVDLQMDAHGGVVTTRTPVDSSDDSSNGTSNGGENTVLRAQFVVGCDGARSFVRQALGLSFEGMTYSIRPMLADVRVTDARDDLPWPRLYNGAAGFTAGVQLRPGHWRIIRLEPTDPNKGEEIPDEEIQGRAAELFGPGRVEAKWASRFRIHLRHAPRFRVGRALLAGDAAHIHSPAGGLGMNAGIHDAHNMAWKLANALVGGDEERLLDSYDAERRAAGVESVSNYADFLTRTFLLSPRLIRAAAFVLVRAMMSIAPLRRNALRRATMIGIRYPASALLDASAPSAGVRLPNVVLRGPDGANCRLYDLLSYGPALLSHGSTQDSEAEELAHMPHIKRIHIGQGGYIDASGKLPALLDGNVGWILVRPDHYIAWVHAGARLPLEAIAFGLGIDPAPSMQVVASEMAAV